jgi:hypothetical protein
VLCVFIFIYACLVIHYCIIETNYTPAPAQPMGMTTTTKVLIGVGVALALGVTIYFVTKKK